MFDKMINNKLFIYMSSINTLVGTFSSLNTGTVDNYSMIQNELICIDTCNNRRIL